MASTRNKNTPGDYKLEKKALFNQATYLTNDIYAGAQPTYFPGDGLGVTKIPTIELSNNWCDIETQLFGIGANNLENPKTEVIPQLNDIKSLNIFNKNSVFIPKPVNVSIEQRPMFLN